jgi:hypothetical protein
MPLIRNSRNRSKPKERKLMPGESRWAFQTKGDGTVISTVTGRHTIPIQRKLQPWWWLYNCDDPRPPADYSPGKPDWLRTALWYLRNPIHNGNFYVWGVADKNFTVTTHFLSKDEKIYWSTLNFRVGAVSVKLPFFAFEGKRWVFKVGWQANGDFQIKVNMSNSIVQLY